MNHRAPCRAAQRQLRTRTTASLAPKSHCPAAMFLTIFESRQNRMTAFHMKTLRPAFVALAALTLALPFTASAAKKSRYADLVLADKPVAYWRLKDTDATTIQNLAPGNDAAALNGTVEGKLELQKLAQKQEQFPDFEPDGTAVQFGEKTGHIQVKDPGANSPLDFKKGDSLTMEAWVSVNALKSGQMVYVIAKGRTGASGVTSQNLNYAMRLKGESGAAHLAFLFRDSDKPATKR